MFQIARFSRYPISFANSANSQKKNGVALSRPDCMRTYIAIFSFSLFLYVERTRARAVEVVPKWKFPRARASIPGRIVTNPRYYFDTARHWRFIGTWNHPSQLSADEIPRPCDSTVLLTREHGRDEKRALKATPHATFRDERKCSNRNSETVAIAFSVAPFLFLCPDNARTLNEVKLTLIDPELTARRMDRALKILFRHELARSNTMVISAVKEK